MAILDNCSTVTLSQYIKTLKTHPGFRDAFVYHRHLPPRKPDYGPQVPFHGDIHETMKQLGLTELYRHQTEAIEHLRNGSNLLVATETASGKSLIYNVTVIEEILKNRKSKAIYIFPLKAPRTGPVEKSFPLA